MLDELGDAAAIVELMRAFWLFTLIVNRDPNSFIEESLFAQAFRELLKTKFDRIKNLCVRLEGDLGPALSRFAGLLESGNGNAAFVFLFVRQAVAPNFQVQRLRKKVHHRNAHAMQAAGNFVGVRVELAAGVKFCHHNFRRRLLFLLHQIDGNAAAVVDYGNGVIKMNRYFNRVAVSCQSLVNRIVDNFVNQMMQAHLACGPYVHSRSLAHGLATFQY